MIFINANSQSFTRNPGQCEFIISSYENPSGELQSPQHTLPPNTVCRYQFQGRRHETVWLSFIKYHSTMDTAVFEAPSDCSAQLRIWDGRLSFPNGHEHASSFTNFHKSDGISYKQFNIIPLFIKENSIYSGLAPYSEHQQRNASLMAEICREEVPKLCSRSLIAKGTRPCSPQGLYKTNIFLYSIIKI